jgi:hypothetical protein
MPKNIVWMSRHAPTPSQVRELDRLYPDHNFIVEGRPFSDAADIVRRFREVEGDEMVVVAPWTVINEIVKQGIHPLVAKMERVSCTSKEAEVVLGSGKKRRCQRFIRFERCDGFDMKLSPVEVATVPTLD